MSTERSTVPGLGRETPGEVRGISKSRKIEEALLSLAVSVDGLEVLHHEVMAGEKPPNPTVNRSEIPTEPLGVLLDILPEGILVLTDRINSCVAKMRECLI
jgi:hypothetical protein